MWRKVNHLAPGTEELAAQYEELPMTGLKVTAHLGKNYAPAIDGAIHLDSLLAYAVMSKLVDMPPLDKHAPKIFPVPLKVLWVSKKGLPLLASTDMVPSDGISSTEYWHKRFPVVPVQRLCVQPNTQVRSGSFKEYRIPVKVITVDSLSGYCIGNAEEVKRLLDNVGFVGKKRSQGKGFVLTWKVSECDVSESDIINSRPVPCEFNGLKGAKIGAWCAPYWFRPWHSVLIA